MFQVGDRVVLGSEGICTIIRSEKRAFDGNSSEMQEYFVLESMSNKGLTCYVPIDQNAMRAALSREEAEKLLTEIPSMEIITEENFQDRVKRMTLSMQASDCREYIRIIKSVCMQNTRRKRADKKISEADKRFLKNAGKLLYGELAHALEVSEEEICDDVMKRIAVLPC